MRNYKNFFERTVFNLYAANDYEYNLQFVKEGIVNLAFVYGICGSGKTNLCLAISTIADIFNYGKIDLQSWNQLNNEQIFLEYEFLLHGRMIKYSCKIGHEAELIEENLAIENQKFCYQHFNNQLLIDCQHGKLVLKGFEDTILKDILKEEDLLEDYAAKLLFTDWISFVEGIRFGISEDIRSQIVHDKVSLLIADDIDLLAEKEFRYFRELAAQKQIQVILTAHRTHFISNEFLRPDGYFNIVDNKIMSFHNRSAKHLTKEADLEKLYNAKIFD